ncbi:MAG: prepilin-type N-terminal cleavage/methylation domain-containing protein [Angelakisella sp.]
MKTLGNQQGFTLVEVMVSALLLTMGALMLATGFVAATKLIDNGNRQEQNGKLVLAAQNGGSTAGTTKTEQEHVALHFRATGGISFEIADGKLVEYSAEDDPTIRFYRYYIK